MTKKVTGKELEKLIEGVLNEKGLPIIIPKDALDNFPKGGKFKASTFPDDPLARALQVHTTAQSNKLRDSSVDRKIFADYVKALSDNDGDQYDITMKDIVQAYLDKEEKAIALADFMVNHSTNFKQDFQKAKDLATSPEGLKKLSDYFKADDSFYQTQQDDEFVPSVELPYRATSTEKEWKIGSKIKPAKAVSKYVIDVFKAGMDEADGDLEKFFQNLSTLGEALAAAAGTTDPQQTPTGMTKDSAKELLKQMDPGKLFNTASLLKTLGFLAKEVQGASAGTFFEVFLALAMGGVVFGGDGGASDVIAGKKGDRLFSAKQYAGEPKGDQAIKNFQTEVKPGNTIWYIGLGKQGAPNLSMTSKGVTDFNRLDVYITGIVRKNQGKGDKVEDYVTITANGQPLGKPLKIATDKSKFSIPYADEPDFKIPISTSWASTETIKSFDKMLSNAIDATEQQVKIKIKEMFAKLQRMKNNSQTFLANKDQKAANKIGEDYVDLKGDFEGGLKIKVPDAKKIEEQKITAKMLQKLVEEKFKK